jgi:hypothetical protein
LLCAGRGHDEQRCGSGQNDSVFHNALFSLGLLASLCIVFCVGWGIKPCVVPRFRC